MPEGLKFKDFSDFVKRFFQLNKSGNDQTQTKAPLSIKERENIKKILIDSYVARHNGNHEIVISESLVILKKLKNSLKLHDWKTLKGQFLFADAFHTDAAYNEIKEKVATANGIKKKLQSAKKLIDIDKEISAGLYTYAIEEFGKALLLNQSELDNGKCKLKYANEFTCHKKNLPLPNYLQNNNHEQCYVLNNEGGFSPYGFSWKGYNIGL